MAVHISDIGHYDVNGTMEMDTGMGIFTRQTNLVVPVSSETATADRRSMAVRVRELSDWMIGNPLMMFDTGDDDLAMAVLGKVASGGNVLWVFRDYRSMIHRPKLINPGEAKEFDSQSPSVLNRMSDIAKANVMAARLEGKTRARDEWRVGNIGLDHWSGGRVMFWALDGGNKQMLRGVEWGLMIVPTQVSGDRLCS